MLGGVDSQDAFRTVMTLSAYVLAAYLTRYDMMEAEDSSRI